MDSTSDRPRRSVRRRIIGLVCAGALLIGGATIGVLALTAPSAAPSAAPPATVMIESGTLSGTTQALGTLDFDDPRDLAAGAAGTMTGIAAAGTTVGIGGGLYRVDDRPVLLLFGSLPVWRSFESGMTDGADILQLEQNLAALGYFDREPDQEFGWSTELAIEAWQKSLGWEQSGSLAMGSVVFMPGEVRMGEVKLAVGAQLSPGAVVATVTSLTKRVDVSLKLSDQRLATVGGAVEISLPNGESAAGTITDVGVPLEREVDGSTTVVVPVGISLDDGSAAAELQRASVRVQFPSESRDHVLSVPLEALIALDADTFGVEVFDPKTGTKKVAVTTGLFAAGRVEISGEGIAAGVAVTVPSS